ncbi:thiamine diphosphate-binding protein [Lipomyces kononenkoae]|uniref:Thiamine diphosphate-binding protein n=1 Tax=Lipomyces kononenkoae TaxID=34357 RepID=A0ACC3SWE6_LIPKO
MTMSIQNLHSFCKYLISYFFFLNGTMAQMKVGSYLFERIKELGIKTVFGVPGDYELVLLDMILDAGVKWAGNANELIASYAADGYARVNGYGAFVTTFGPGELSAYCGMAGQYAEYVPVVHIVGYPSTKAMKEGAIMHHSLGDGNFRMYHEMVRNITVASTILDDPATATAEIDRVLKAMAYFNRPVYIGVPVDVGPQTIVSRNLETPLPTTLPPNPPELEQSVVDKIVDLLSSRKHPIIVVDGGAVRNGVIEESSELIKLLQIPYFVTGMSKGGISEALGRFGGVYGGGASVPGVKRYVEALDLVLFIGSYKSDFNTGEFTAQISPSVIVDLQRFTTNVLGTDYKLSMKYVLHRLVSVWQSGKNKLAVRGQIEWDPYPLDQVKASEKLTQDFLWAALGRYFKSGDYIIAETGTSAYGILASNLKNIENVHMYNQTVYGSIGFATGAALGSFLAGKESNTIKRGILVTGEGSLQLTVQAFSDMLRYQLNVTVFVLNNAGYTIERLIHGMEASYNTIPEWDYSKICALFGPAFQNKYHRIETPEQLLKLLSDPEFNAANCTQVVELILNRRDAPTSVIRGAEAVEKFNKGIPI